MGDRFVSTCRLYLEYFCLRSTSNGRDCGRTELKPLKNLFCLRRCLQNKGVRVYM